MMLDRSMPYRDTVLRIVLCLIAAHLMANYDGNDSFFEAIFSASYRRAFGVSFVISMLVFSYIRYLSMRLDRNYNWKSNTLNRLFLQFIFGLVIPSVTVALLIAGYFAFYGRMDLYTLYLQEDIIVAVMMIIIVNLFYFGLSLYYQIDSTQNIPENRFVMEHSNEPTGTVIQSISEPEDPKEYLQVLIIDTVSRSIPVKTKDIAYFFILSDIVYARTFDMTSLNECYPVSETLKELQEKLDPKFFFRLNRKIIVNYKACSHFSAYNSKTISVALMPPLYTESVDIPKDHERLCVVASAKTTAFKEWMTAAGS